MFLRAPVKTLTFCQAALAQAGLIMCLHGFPGWRTQAGVLEDREARGQSLLQQSPYITQEE